MNRARPGYVPPAGLTPRMLDYVRCAAEGLTRRETAARLWVAPCSVDHAWRRIYERLGARTVAHAVAIAYRTGALDATPPAPPHAYP